MFFLLIATVPVAEASSVEARDCVIRIGQAIDEADVQSFSRLCDVDTLLEKGFDAFLQWSQKPEIVQRMQPMLAVALAQAARDDSTGKTVRLLLLREFRAFLLDGIASGAFAGRKTGQRVQSGMLAPLFANASLGRKEIRNVEAGDSYEGGRLVHFLVYDADNGNEYPLNGFVREEEGGMRLIYICNIQELFERISEEAEQYNE